MRIAMTPLHMRVEEGDTHAYVHFHVCHPAAAPQHPQVPVGLIVLTSGAEASPAQVEEEVIRAVREQIGPVAAFRHVAVVQALPKTRSGKTLRGILQKIADGVDYRLPGTIEDEAPVAACAEALGTLGYPQSSRP